MAPSVRWRSSSMTAYPWYGPSSTIASRRRSRWPRSASAFMVWNLCLVSLGVKLLPSVGEAGDTERLADLVCLRKRVAFRLDEDHGVVAQPIELSRRGATEPRDLLAQCPGLVQRVDRGDRLLEHGPSSSDEDRGLLGGRPHVVDEQLGVEGLDLVAGLRADRVGL